MSRIGIIAAMKPEMDFMLKEIGECSSIKICGQVFYTGTIGNVDVVLSECGVGKVNASSATTILISQFECNMIINTGIAGGIGLKAEDVVIASSLSYYDFDTTIFGYAYGQVPGLPKEFVAGMDSIVMVKSILNKLGVSYEYCPVFSGDQFVQSLDQLKKINLPLKAACEMEGAAVAQVAIRSGVDFIILRYISDIIGQEGQIEDYMRFEQKMAQRSCEICLQILNNL